MSSIAKEFVQPPRGMRDFSPKEMEEREALKELILSEYKAFGYQTIGTPVLENAKVLQAKAGDENEKLMFQILKRGDQLEESFKKGDMKELSDLGLRFDLTVPLCRYIATHAADVPNVFRVCRIDNAWRAERPQKGRFREFIQCDVDIVGGEGISYEVELLLIAERILKKLDLGTPRIRVNDRRLLKTVLEENGATEDQVGQVYAWVDRLDKIGKENVLKELSPLLSETVHKLVCDMLDGKDIFTSENAKNIKADIDEVLTNLTEINEGKTNAFFDPLLMRGMDYYTGIVFEAELDGLNVSVGGGGRYDNLIGTFLGRKIPAVGISLGFERLLTIMEQQGKSLLKGKAEKVRIMCENKSENEQQIMALKLREKGLIVDVDFAKRRFEKKLKSAENEGFTYIITNFEGETLTVRNIKERQTKEVLIADFISSLSF